YPKAVGVAVETQTQLGFAAADKPADFGHAFGVWLRVMTAEKRIEFVMEHRDLCARLLQQGIEVTPPGAIHEFHRNFESRLLNRAEVQHFAQLFEILRLRIDQLGLVS